MKRLTSLAGTQFGVAGAQAGTFSTQIRSSRFHTANLTAQFNDIGVMLGSGQSPLTLAVQQGTQITQVLQTMGGTAKQQVGALIGAFRQMISPTALVVVGVIALGVVLARLGIKFLLSRDATSKYEDNLKLLEDTLENVGGTMDIFSLTLKEQKEKWGENTTCSFQTGGRISL